jgi:lysophospholipase L1-like esterase
MKRLIILIFLVIAMFITVIAEPIRIVPIGDSITQGGRSGREEYTYRYPLFCKMKDAGYDFDFIGSLKSGLNADAKWPDYKAKPFDTDHEGHYGWKTAAVRDKLQGWVNNYPTNADIALIHLGTNDQGSKDFNKDIIEPMKDMVKILREKNPRVVVIFAHLNFNGGKALEIRPLVTKMAEEITTKESPVLTVNMYEGWTEDPQKEATDTFDWAHPNPQGQKKMAEKWFEKMKPFLDNLAKIKKNKDEKKN